MFPLASFNGGPSDGDLILAALVGVLASTAIGYRSRRVLLGAIGGGLGGALICLLMLTGRGGFLGGEFLLPIVGLGSGITGGVAGVVGRFRRADVALKSRRFPSGSDLDA